MCATFSKFGPNHTILQDLKGWGLSKLDLEDQEKQMSNDSLQPGWRPLCGPSYPSYLSAPEALEPSNTLTNQQSLTEVMLLVLEGDAGRRTHENAYPPHGRKDLTN